MTGDQLGDERQAEARAILARGDDPAALKREAAAQAQREAVQTFEAVAREWLGHQAGRWAADTLAAMADLRAAFNPRGLCNPDKLVPSSRSCVEVTRPRPRGGG